MSFVLGLQAIDNQSSEDPHIMISTWSFLLCASSLSTFVCFQPESS
ncbi:SapB/AmfS family lanthipeptide [Virgisporangium aurantiacum]|uniref:Uncharacterized protein n=1 Tax=Virgisporangium aurantiacum TaxID=175570 RepID=A0A8J3ZHF5_9ACTN|nr:SapB/AmfS family lanthipeptide [Virgisporangium aurantiacum]GIJ63959.1 hypothetical protein Vau01_114750 [Virgisporangium aurantiacum]